MLDMQYVDDDIHTHYNHILSGTGYMTQLIEYLFNMHKALSLVPEPLNLLGGAALYSQHLGEVEALGSEVQRHLLLHSELEASLGMKICLLQTYSRKWMIKGTHQNNTGLVSSVGNKSPQNTERSNDTVCVCKQFSRG